MTEKKFLLKLKMTRPVYSSSAGGICSLKTPSPISKNNFLVILSFLNFLTSLHTLTYSHRMNPFQDNSVIAMAANSSPYFSNTAENPSVIMFQLQRRCYCFFA